MDDRVFYEAIVNTPHCPEDFNTTIWDKLSDSELFLMFCALFMKEGNKMGKFEQKPIEIVHDGEPIVNSDEVTLNSIWGKWVISEVRCPECLEYFDPECFSKEEMNKCPNCGAIMRKEEPKNE